MHTHHMSAPMGAHHMHVYMSANHMRAGGRPWRVRKKLAPEGQTSLPQGETRGKHATMGHAGPACSPGARPAARPASQHLWRRCSTPRCRSPLAPPTGCHLRVCGVVGGGSGWCGVCVWVGWVGAGVEPVRFEALWARQRRWPQKRLRGREREAACLVSSTCTQRTRYTAAGGLVPWQAQPRTRAPAV